jgi:poly(3-hydroxybutyrate) depolymerase
MKTLFKVVCNALHATSQPTKAAIARIAVATAVTAFAVSLSPVHAADAPSLKRVPISVGGGMAGANRGYSYYASSKANHAGYNYLVFALHDNGQTAEQFARDSGWIKVAEENGFVVVFPEAVNKTWSPYSGEEDAYLKATYDSASTSLTAEPRPDDPPPRGGRGGGEAAEGGAAPPPMPAAGPAAGGEGGGGRGAGEGAGARPQGVRIGTWQPWQYFTGAGAGARVVQEFAIDHPGLVTAVATLDGVAYGSTYAKGNEVSQGYFQDQRGGKTVIPLWRPLKKDVPVPAWLFTSASPTAGATKLADYWKHSNGVVSAADNKIVSGFQTAVYTNPRNSVEQVRITSVPAAAKYDEAMASAAWQFFSHIARWTSSPNGELGPMMPEPEVNQAFEVRQSKLGDRTYKYYVKTPSSYTKGKSLPLVISLHGGGYPAWMYLSQIKFHEVGEKEGFITVYPSGQRNGWNFNRPETEDMKFFAQLIDEMAANYGIDKTRVYMQGFSIGSGTTFVTGITHPQLFAAVSPNSGIGDFDASVMSYVADLKTKSDIRVPMIIFYGAVDGASSTDGLVPGDGILQRAIANMKKYNGITTPDTVKTFDSPNAPPYDILIPGGKLNPAGVDAHYPKGRIQRYDYLSADTKQPLFSWAWVVDMPHGTAPGQTQMIWDYFKNWSRSPDGSLKYSGR